MMRSEMRGCLAGLVLVALPSQGAAQIRTSTDLATIEQAVDALHRANAADDVDTALGYYWRDSRLTVIDPDDGFKILGWDDWRQYLLDQRTLRRTLSWRPRHQKVRVRGNNACVTFYVSRHVQFGSTVFKKNERGSYILRKIDDEWLIVAHHISAFPPMLKFQQTAEKQGRDPESSDTFDLDEYYDTMVEDMAVYDPASPWLYDGKEPWVRRVDQMQDIRQFLDLNFFNKTEVEWDDLRIMTVDRELRRPEGSFTERNHGRITVVYLKQPDGRWFYWHDHTSEIPEDFSYQQ